MNADESKLSGRDLVRVGSLGLRSRRVRALLSALGISIGIAAIVGVLGISQSSKSGLLAELGREGNLLNIQPGQSAFGQQSELPVAAEGMVARIGPVTDVTKIGSVSNTYVYRNSLVPAINTNGISVVATDSSLPATLGATVAARHIPQRGHRALTPRSCSAPKPQRCSASTLSRLPPKCGWADSGSPSSGS